METEVVCRSLLPEGHAASLPGGDVRPIGVESPRAFDELLPEPTLIEQILRLAQQRGQSPETILTGAVRLYLDTQTAPAIPNDPDDASPSDASDRQTDPLIGLFSGSPDLSIQGDRLQYKPSNLVNKWQNKLL